MPCYSVFYGVFVAVYLRSVKANPAGICKGLSIEHWSQPVAVTLTMKKALLGEIFHVGSEGDYSQNLKHALNLVNHRLFGPRWRTKGKRLEVLPALEQDAAGRAHYHLAVNLAGHISREDFNALIREVWPKTRWGYKQTHVGPANSRWVTYLIKLRSKKDPAAPFDLDNLHYWR